jgi:hypothetical protein
LRTTRLRGSTSELGADRELRSVARLSDRSMQPLLHGRGPRSIVSATTARARREGHLEGKDDKAPHGHSKLPPHTRSFAEPVDNPAVHGDLVAGGARSAPPGGPIAGTESGAKLENPLQVPSGHVASLL